MRKGRVEYFMQIAEVVKNRGTCNRLNVGCVLTSEDNRIVSVGYNSAPAGEPHCEEIGCLISKEFNDKHCIRTIHAETGAVANLPKRYKLLICYVTTQPCLSCLKMLVASNVKKVYYKDEYDSKDRDLFIRISKMEMEKV